MLQYKIPQNIGIEDKIVGPFSLKQLIILAIGGGISYTLFAVSSRLYELNTLEYILIALPALFSLAAAMLKIHNVSFMKYILLMIEFAIKPKKRMWDHRGISALVAPDLTEKKAEDKNKNKSAEKSRKNVNLSHLSAMLDSGGFEHMAVVSHEDIDKVNDDDLITEAYFGHKKKESSTGNMYWRTREVQKKKLDILAKIQKPATAPSAPAPKPAQVVAPAPVQAAPTTPPAAAMTEKPAEKPSEIKVEITKQPEIKKESVTEHLANVIKEARKNNEAKKQPAPQQAPTPPMPLKQETQIPKATVPTSSETPKKKRKRKKKPKLQSQPVRQDTQVNTTSKTEPNKLIKKPEMPQEQAKTVKPVQPPEKPAPAKIEQPLKPVQPVQPVQPAKNEKETSFSDLSGGDEIEINLD